MNSLTMVSVLALSFGLSIAHADVKSDRAAVNQACSQDAQTAGCGSETVGKGLLKCLRAYKKEHKEFKFSSECKKSLTTLHADRKAKRAEKQEEKKDK